MSLDPYSPCPCGSGKKLKFCCSDLAPEIEKIYRMIEGEQPRAALARLKQLLAKRPEPFSLLDLKATLEISLGELDEAKPTLDSLLSLHGDHPATHANLAIFTTMTDGAEAAIGHLQDAMDRLDENMPRQVLDAIGSVGHGLLIDGDLIAARAHLLMAVGIGGKDQHQAFESLMRINLHSGLPLIMRDALFLAEPPPGASWGPALKEANQLAVRGLWRQAETRLANLLSDTSPQPQVLYNLTLVRGWLGQKEAFASGLHQFARLDVPLEDAVEAESLAQMVDPTYEEPMLETLRLVYPISDIEALAEKFAIDPRIDLCLPSSESSEHGELARPRSEHLLLDRPLPASGVDLKRSDVPHVVAFLAIHGKRTDREARLEITIVRENGYQQAYQTLGELAGDLLSEDFPEHPLEEEVVDQEPLGDVALRWRWRLPYDTPEAQRRKLIKLQRRHAILNQWPSAPRAALGGATPEEARDDQDLQIPLLASLLLVEQAITDPAELTLIQDLRERLQLPSFEPIEPAEVIIDRIPLVRVHRLRVDQMPSEQLARVLNRGSMTAAHLAVLKVAEELVQRKEPSDNVDKATAYRWLIRMSPTLEQALDRLGAARAWSRHTDQSEAPWAVLELEVNLKAQDAHAAERVLNEIRDHHMTQPGVAEAVGQILQQAGLLTPDGSPQMDSAAIDSQPAHDTQAESTATGGPHQKIWTPEETVGNDLTGTGPSGQEKPAIWTPS